MRIGLMQDERSISAEFAHKRPSSTMTLSRGPNTSVDRDWTRSSGVRTTTAKSKRDSAFVRLSTNVCPSAKTPSFHSVTSASCSSDALTARAKSTPSEEDCPESARSLWAQISNHRAGGPSIMQELHSIRDLPGRQRGRDRGGRIAGALGVSHGRPDLSRWRAWGSRGSRFLLSDLPRNGL